MKIGIFYGSTTGSTEEVAGKIATALGVASSDVHNVADTAPSAVDGYDVLILGSSTWGDGELQDDWYDFLDGLSALDLKGKKIALFGCGDENMSSTFCNAVGILHDKLKATGAQFIGQFNTEGYTFDSSEAIEPDGQAYGLLIDESNHSDLTDSRIKAWTEELKKEF